MKIEGVPDGWKVVRIGTPLKNEWFILHNGRITQSSGSQTDKNYPIIRKVERPKQYRPFANAEEFKPHRDRWWMWKEDTSRFFPPASYDEFSHESETWNESFDFKVFEDGSPFGVEVSE